MKIRELPESKRKIIFWLIIIIFGLGLLTFWIKTTQERIKTLGSEQVEKEWQVPKLKEELKALPKLEMPEVEIPEQELKKLEKKLKEDQK